MTSTPTPVRRALLVAALALAACSGDDAPPSASCGDGACRASDGETMDTCTLDCSGHCAAGQIYCENDGRCEAPGTDCSLPIYTCSEGGVRCPSHDVAFNCCDPGTGPYVVHYCPSAMPVYCTTSAACVENRAACPDTTCNAAESCE